MRRSCAPANAAATTVCDGRLRHARSELRRLLQPARRARNTRNRRHARCRKLCMVHVRHLSISAAAAPFVTAYRSVAAVDCSSSLPFCAACNLAGNPGAPTLFHAQLQDGAGAVALQAVAIAAYAAERGWNYGGSFLPCAPNHVLCQGSCIRESKCPRLFTHAFTASEAIALLLGDGLTHSLAGVNSTESLATAFGASRDDDRSAVVTRSVKALGRLQPPVAADISAQTRLPWPGRPLAGAADFFAAFRRDACRVTARTNGTRLSRARGRRSRCTCGAATAASGCSRPPAAVERCATAGRAIRTLGSDASARKLLPTADVHVFSSTEARRRRRIRSCGARTGGRARRCTSTRWRARRVGASDGRLRPHHVALVVQRARQDRQPELCGVPRDVGPEAAGG